MAITWGAWHGHLRTGIEVWVDPYNTYTSSVTMYVDTYLQCDGSFSFNDSQTLSLTGDLSRTWNFTNNLGPNQVLYVGQTSQSGLVQSYGGGPTYHFVSQLSGAFNGAAPWVEVWYTLPARPARVPTPPGTPSFSSVTSTSAFASWTPSTDHGGSGTIENQFEVATNSSFTNIVHQAFTGLDTRQITGLSPGVTYYGRVRVRNAVGWSGWSGTGTFSTVSGAKVKGPSGWVDAVAFGKGPSGWVPLSIYKKVNGIWVL